MKHLFDVEIASLYGVNAAILLENIGYWIKQNEANGTNYFEGKYWTFNSRRAYRELFPYMSERQINTAFQKLIESGLIITGNYNKLAYDRTLWYALTQKGKSILHFDIMENTKMSNGNEQNVTPIPNINTGVNTSINTDKKKSRHKYGLYENVLLTDEELEKLKAEFPSDYKSRIERLSEYIASSGKKYKNHLATIRSWARRNDKQGKAPTREYNNEELIEGVF